jgi:hypothetical protein
VTNQEKEHIEVSFSFNGFVNHRYLNERFDRLLERIGTLEVEMSKNLLPTFQDDALVWDN